MEEKEENVTMENSIEKTGMAAAEQTENLAEALSPAEKSGRKLSRLREKKGYTVKELARQSGIQSRIISRLENGTLDLNKRPCEEIMQLVYAIGGRCRMEDLLCVERFDLRAYEEQCRMEYIARIERLKVEKPEEFARIQEEKAKKKQELAEQQARIKEEMKTAQEKLEEQMRVLYEKQQKLRKQTDNEDFELYEV